MVHGVAPLLITSAVGYWVLSRAYGEKAPLKKIGQLLGLVIIGVSLIGAACKIYYQVTGCPPGKGIFCPYGKQAPSSPQ